MKRLCLPCFFILATIAIFAQSPQSIPYQAVARNTAGDLISNQAISLRFTIHDVSSTGTTLYQETQSATTNKLGLFNVAVGTGTRNVSFGTFAAITWASANAKFLQVELDPTGGTTYTNMGTTQMMSVPFALYAGSAPGDNWGAQTVQTNSSLTGAGTSGSQLGIATGGVTNAMLANPSLTIATSGTSGLTGGGSVALGGTLNIAANPDNSTIKVNGSNQLFAANTGTVTSIATGSGLTGGPITGTGTIGIAPAGVTNAMLANSAINVSASGAGISVSGSPVSLGGTVTLSNTGVTSIVAGTNVSVSGATGAVTVNSTVPAGSTTADNGVNVNTGNNVELGGALTKATTIAQAGFNYTHNLTGIGDFVVQNNGASALYIMGHHTAANDGFVGIGAAPSGPLDVTGNSGASILSRIYFRNASTFAGARSDINITATGSNTGSPRNLYFGVDDGTTGLGSYTATNGGAYLDNRTSGPLVFENNGAAAMAVNSGGSVTVSNLAGTGYRAVFADGSGTLSTISGTGANKRTFTYSGGIQTLTVPAGVTLMYVKLWGAGGGSCNNASVEGPGGGGGFVSGFLTVVPGHTLNIMVGQGGQANGTATYGGGGAGVSGNNGGSGGGRSAIMDATVSSTTDVVTAGAGGGSAHNCSCYGGGAGGGPIGGFGGGATSGGLFGTGGTQTGGGKCYGTGSVTAGTCSGTGGNQYQGGAGCSAGWSGGGGGGWYGGGGGGGSAINGPGGGGSSYTANLVQTMVIRNEQGLSNPNLNYTYWAGGNVYYPGGVSDPDYSAGIGVGGASLNNGGNGLVVIYW